MIRLARGLEPYTTLVKKIIYYVDGYQKLKPKMMESEITNGEEEDEDQEEKEDDVSKLPIKNHQSVILH